MGNDFFAPVSYPTDTESAPSPREPVDLILFLSLRW
jgi:hypothetical protein